MFSFSIASREGLAAGSMVVYPSMSLVINQITILYIMWYLEGQQKKKQNSLHLSHFTASQCMVPQLCCILFISASTILHQDVFGLPLSLSVHCSPVLVMVLRSLLEHTTNPSPMSLCCAYVDGPCWKVIWNPFLACLQFSIVVETAKQNKNSVSRASEE